MTRREQAQVRKLRKRLDACFAALCIIKTWLGFPEDFDALRIHIAELCERHILAEKEARRKESEVEA